MKMDYKLISADNIDKYFIKQAKLTTIFSYAKNTTEKERERIFNYVVGYVDKFLKDYKIIVVKEEKCGVLFVREFDDGFLIDEIYLIEKFRGFGIGSSIIKNLIEQYDKLYLWVYKENVKAIKLYKGFNFKIKEENKDRYLMVYNK